MPLVQTKGTTYSNNNIMTNGENAIVMIGCYSGFNQEDSIIINRGSLERGLFKSVSYKKYEIELEKNNMTTQVDSFTKPDPKITLNMKDGNYEKLNDKGYIPEETVIENGDVIFGKVIPIQNNDKSNKYNKSNKIFTDDSKIYKSNYNGVVDKVLTDNVNSEGYDMYVMRVRAERNITIGDKLCMTPDHDVLTDKGWINITKLNMDYNLATLDDNHNLIYTPILKIHEYDYKGKMYEIKNN
jgi:DNA-directed RNA polymerase II subunit RPB2